MLHFLTLKDEFTSDAQLHYNKNVADSPIFPSLLSEDQIQKVIVDEKYLKYVARGETPKPQPEKTKAEV